MPKKKLDKIDQMVLSRCAPLVETERDELGDKRLDPKEAVIRHREELLGMCESKKIGGQAELEDMRRSEGRRLQWTEVIGRLKAAAPQLRALDSQGGEHIALYYPRTGKEREDALADGKDERGEFFDDHKYVGGFPKQEIPEYGSVDIDTSHLPTREGWMANGKFVAGHSWRSVLIGLLKHGVLSYSQAVARFGDVGTDRRGWRWSEQTRKWRQNPDRKFAQTAEPLGDI